MLKTQDKSQDIQELYKHICKLNYFQHFQKAKRDDTLANPELDQLIRTKSQQITKIPLNFSSASQYIKFWKNMFYQQLNGFVASIKLSQIPNPQKIILKSYFELGSFKIFQFQKAKQSQAIYMSGTMVTLSPQKKLQQQDQPHLIGIVQKYDTSIYIRVILGAQRTSIQSEQLKIFTKSSTWYIQSLCQLTSIQRQYKALTNFQKIDPIIKQCLLQPKSHKDNCIKLFHISPQLNKTLQQSYNQSQYDAIIQSLKQEGVTLIQGPPGTGKTKTVLGTLSVLLQSTTTSEQDEQLPLLMRWKTSQQDLKYNCNNINPWFSNTDWQDWRDQPYISSQHQLLNLTKIYQKSNNNIILKSFKSQTQPPKRVLVCGPSNASVDQVMRKLLQQKLLDKDAKPYLPNFIRLGQNYHQQLQQYSLDYLSNQVVKKDKIDLVSARKKVIKDARIVFSTLSSAGSSTLQQADLQFDTVIIDEAGQAIEISSLIPLLNGCKRLILIGDPKQLPATVFSSTCLQQHYDQSLFQRLMKAQYPINMLKIQYRMNPQISKIICQSFYQGLLQNGNMMEFETSLPHAFIMLHIQNSSQIFGQQSYYNPIQAESVKIIVNWLSKDYKDIGVVSPYSAQVKLMSQQKLNNCEVKTIDSFQGREKQVIIYSTVRATLSGKDKRFNKKKTIGFVGDGRRINVAISRAKQVCIIVGDLDRLQLNRTWKKIIQESQSKGQAYRTVCIEQLRQIGQGFKNLRKY